MNRKYLLKSKNYFLFLIFKMNRLLIEKNNSANGFPVFSLEMFMPLS